VHSAGIQVEPSVRRGPFIGTCRTPRSRTSRATASADRVAVEMIARDERRLLGGARLRLQEREQRRRAGTGAQHQVAARSPLAGHVPIRPFDQHPRAAQPRQSLRAVTDAAPHGPRSRTRRRQGPPRGEGMPAAPARTVGTLQTKSPAGRARRECAPAHADDDGAGPIAFDRFDPDDVTCRTPQRHPDRNTRTAPAMAATDPTSTPRRMLRKVGARPQHVGDGETDAEISVEVQQVPRLVPETPPRRMLVAAQDQQRAPRRGEEHSG
jgi:hypothetical protein